MASHMAPVKLLGALALLPLVFSQVAASWQFDLKRAINAECQALEYFLPGKVAYPNEAVYNASLASYFSTQEQSISPGCVISPTSSADVAKIVIGMAGAHAQNPSLGQFAIRGGGHTPFAAAANIASGITIDMRGIKTISVNAAKTVTSVGGGAIWSDIYALLDPMGLSVVGGRVAGIGAGGLTTGGL